MTSALEPVWIGVDVGGTKVLAGAVDEKGRVVRTARRATPGRRVDIAQVEDSLEAAVLEAADGAPIAGVGVAAAGFDPRLDLSAQLSWPGAGAISPGGSPGSARAPAARGTVRHR